MKYLTTNIKRRGGVMIFKIESGQPVQHGIEPLTNLEKTVKIPSSTNKNRESDHFSIFWPFQFLKTMGKVLFSSNLKEAKCFFFFFCLRFGSIIFFKFHRRELFYLFRFEMGRHSPKNILHHSKGNTYRTMYATSQNKPWPRLLKSQQINIIINQRKAM